MAAKRTAKSGRHDPKKNKSLAIRTVLGKMSQAKASEVVDVVKKEYGHQVKPNMVYMVKTKMNMASDGRVKKSTSKSGGTPMTTASMWVNAIKVARQLLKETGGLDNAVALLKAVDG